PAADGLACMVEARIVATEDDAVIVDLVARGPDRRRQRRGRLAREPAIDGRAGRSPREEHRTWAAAPATRVSARDSMGAPSGAAAHRFLRPRASTAFLNSSTESRSAFCSNGRRSGPGTQKPMSTACEQVALVRVPAGSKRYVPWTSLMSPSTRCQRPPCGFSQAYSSVYRTVLILMSSAKATRGGRPSGWRSRMRHSFTGPDHSGYASKSMRTAKQSSTEPATSAEYDCEKSLTAGGRYRAPRRGVKDAGGRRGAVAYGTIRVCSRPMPVRTIEWRNGRVVMLDQRLLPTREVYRVYSTHADVARAIKDMVARGAPALRRDA